MGWVGSPGLTEAMLPAPCGCELAAQAEREVDPRARRAKLSEAAKLQARWGCPGAGHEPPARLTGPQATVAGAVQVLTGGTREEPLAFSTCPLWYVRAPWVHEVARAHAWWTKGSLGALSQHPSAALVDAVDAVERGVRARERDDYERARTAAAPKGGRRG